MIKEKNSSVSAIHTEETVIAMNANEAEKIIKAKFGADSIITIIRVSSQ